MMTISALGHTFHMHGGEEMMCPTCGYVIWPVETEQEAIKAVTNICGDAKNVPHCGGAWHAFIRKRVTQQSKDVVEQTAQSG